MLSVYILRHGKSDWEADHGTDHDRPLARRGKRAARRMGRFLARLDEEPELILCSSARRARRTAVLAMQAGNWRSRLVVEPDLYERGSLVMAELLHSLIDGPTRVMFVGHQPACGSFIGEMTSSAAPAFPTAALARMDLPATSWSRVSIGLGQLKWLVTPRLLAALEPS